MIFVDEKETMLIFPILHKAMYPLLKRMFAFIRKHTFVFVNDMPLVDSNAIFAVNHFCRFDIPYACEAIGRHSYVLVGKQPLELPDKLFFKINGAVWVDRKDKDSRKKSKEKMVALLKKGASLLMFPEGTWNLTPSKPMLPLYWGIIDIARETRCPILPVVLEYYKEECFISFGQCIKVEEQDDKKEKILDLADMFASMK